MSADVVDITIVGTVMMCFGFAVGIVISAREPKKSTPAVDQPIFYRDEAKRLVEKFAPLVDSEEATDMGFCFCREKYIANAKQCALIAAEFADSALLKEGIISEYAYNLKKAIEQYNG